MQSESPSVERALTLLEMMLERPYGVRSAELLRSTGLSRSALFALLNALKSLGYIAQPQRGYYEAGPRLLAWSRRAALTSDFQNAFYQEAAALKDSETLGLVVPAGEDAVLIAQIESQKQLRSTFPPHHRFSPQSAAVKALTTTPTPEVRRDRYARHEEEGVLELALPICADGSTPCAALLWSAPACRWEKTRLTTDVLPSLREIAARLSYRLGARQYTPWQSARTDATTQSRSLSSAEIAELLRAPLIARLACLRPDGRPHVVPVWQEWDGKYFYVIAWPGSLWAEYLRQTPHLSLTIDEPWPPLRRILARGYAEPLDVEAMPGGLTGLLDRMRRRYLGPNGALPGGDVRPFRILSQTLSGWQGLPWKFA